MHSITIAAATAPTDEVRNLIAGLEDELACHYTPEQRHGVPLVALFQPHIRFFIARLDGQPAGCGGVAMFDDFAEVKRMFVQPEFRRHGIAQTLLQHLEAQARGADIKRLRLETGIHQKSAIRLYEQAGFNPCPAFEDYLTLPASAIVASLFFHKSLD